MATPTITFNSGTGSDTAASGAGPATAVSGVAAAHTGGVASTTITLTNTPSLSGVAVDGTAALWLKTSSGRQYSKIIAVDDAADTVTVEDSFTIASGSAVDYAIGGKRATLDHADSRTVFADYKDGWIIQIEDNQSITSSAISISGGNTNVVLAIKSDSTTIRTITQSANAGHFTIDGAGVPAIRCKYLKFANSNVTKTAAIAFVDNRPVCFSAIGCIFGDSTNSILNGVLFNFGSSDLARSEFIDCEVVSCTGTGLLINSQIHIGVYLCWIRDNVIGIDINNGYLTMSDTIVEGNSSSGIRTRAMDVVAMLNNTIHNNTSHGLDMTRVTESFNGIIANNNFTMNGGYGLKSSTSSKHNGIIDFNNYGTGSTANTSGDVLGFTKGSNSLNVDPQYTATGSDDYSVGANLKAAGSPDTTRTIGANQSGTNSYVDIGAAQRQEPAGGGGGDVRTKRLVTIGN